MKTPRLILAAAMGLMSSPLIAQIPGTSMAPRTEDHFQRKLVVSRIDLNEKINAPLVSSMSLDIYEESKFNHNQGIVNALINGLKSGKYLAYDPDDLSKPMTYEDVQALSSEVNASDPSLEEPIEEPIDETYLYEENEVIEDGDGSEEGVIDVSNAGELDGGVQTAPLESAIEIIENRIFDKNRSAEIYDIKYIRLVWVDPGETLPDKNFVCFKYSDVVETLENTRWANRFNDAEDRNLREIFEDRLFNGFVINVSGQGARTLPESHLRSQQLLEFEHHLWSN